MFGLTRYVPITTSLTALSLASFVDSNQLAHVDRNDRWYQGAAENDDNRWRDKIDDWDDELKIASGQRKPDNLSAYSISSDNDKRVVNSDTDFPAAFELSSLDGRNGFQINGISAYDRSGSSVSSAGDVNADGYADIIIGASSANPHGLTDAGESYVLFGKTSGFGMVELSNLDGENGFQINGISLRDYSGLSVSGAGDVNGDGYADVIIGAYGADPHGVSFAGESYVVFGKASGFETVELSSLDGNNGFQLNGVSLLDSSGLSVSGAGDVNGDGYADVIIGAYRASPHGKDEAGESYVVFGKASGFGTVELSNLDGENGFQINGISSEDHSGRSVSGAGDVNGDGYDDVIIGAYYAHPHDKNAAGESYVVFGKASGFGAVELSGLDGENGFQINGISSSDVSGRSVSGAGDVNHDGYDDIIIGAYGADPHGRSYAGESYVVFGKASGFEAVELSSLDGVNGFQLNGVSSGDSSGWSVGGAGDLNGDGYADIIIGAFGAHPDGKDDAGESYVVFGKSSGFGTVELSSLDGVNGFQLNGISSDDYSGTSVSGAGDVNHDGCDDIVVGASSADPHGKFSAGESYVVFGAGLCHVPTPSPTPSPLYPEMINVSELNGQTGSTFVGANNRALMGISVSRAGDVNIDGIDDVIVGASGTIVNGLFNAGTSYVVFGNREGFPANASATKFTASGDGFNVIGEPNEMGFATSVSGIGDVNRDGRCDVMVGSPYGVDKLNIQTGKAYVVYGSQGNVSQTVNVTQLDGENGFGIEGEFYADQLGAVVSGAGDINRDGASDLMVSAPYASADGQTQSGKVYVILGDDEGSPSVFNVTSLNGTNGFSITGENAFDRMGGSLSGIGDINGDGIDDIAIGAPEATTHNEFQAGKVYVLFGHRDGFSNITQVSSLNGENGFSLNGERALHHFGTSISSAELNQDGVSDLIVGAPNAQNSAGFASGKVYVLYGRRGGFASEYNVSLLTPSEGFTLEGASAGDKVGSSVSGVGDFNVDGLEDVLIGAPQASANNQLRAGKGYVFFGRYGGYPSDIALSSLDGSTGFTIEGEQFGDNLGSSVSRGGDINQDGVPDILLGAPGTDNGGTGYTALVYGGVSLFSDASQGQSLRAQNNNILNQEASAAANDVTPMVPEAPVFV